MHRTLLLTLALLVVGADDAAAQTRQITALVVDSATSQPVPLGQAVVRGTTNGTNIKEDGTFTLTVPAGDVTLSIRSIGYKRVDVLVSAGQNRVRVALVKDYFQLETQVITGQATGIERQNLATAVATVNAEALTKAPQPSIEGSLQGKVAGGQFLSNSGSPGGGMRVQLRGTTTIIGQNSPLYVVDGLVVSDVAIPPGTNPVTRASGTAVEAGNQESPVNRIADLNPNDIENIEVLKGAAASAIYGSKASNGVILITTKKGVVGAAQYTFTQRVGVPQVTYKNGYRRFQTLADATTAFGSAAATYWTPNYTPHNLEDYLYDNHPLGYETQASVTGGTESTRYFASLDVKHEGGIVVNTYADKQSVRLNLDQLVNSRLSVGVNTSVIRSAADRGLFGNDNTATSLGYTVNNVPNFIDLRAVCPDGSRKVLCDGGVYPVNPFQSSNPVQTAAMIKIPETVWRVISTGQVRYDALKTDRQSLRVLANGGVDFFNQKDVVQSPPELQFEPADGLLGTYALAYSQNVNTNVNLNLVHEFTPTNGKYRATTSVGLQQESRELSTSRTIAQNLLGGVASIQTATTFVLGEVHTLTQDFGMFAQEEVLLLNDRLFLTAGVRADRSSNDGDPRAFFVYPKTSASYRFTRLPRLLSDLKVRAAYGQSGNQPLYGQKFTNLVSSNQDGLGGFQLSATAGASDLKPERQREIELGVDATAFSSRANLELTVFEKNITDLLLNRTLPPSSGFGSERFNGGVLRTRGIEASLGIVPVRTSTLTWNTRFNYAMNQSLIMSLPVPAFQLGGSYQRGSSIIQVGHSPTEFYGNDTLPGGSPTNITIIVRSLGDMNPRYTLNMANDVTWKGFSFYALLDGRSGGFLAAGTFRRAIQARNSPDFDNPTPSGMKLGEQQILYNPAVTRVMVHDASFVKLREARIGWDVPKSLVQRLSPGARYIRMNLAGRNLWQSTPYRGGDPEVNNFGFSDALGGVRENGVYPPSRSFWFSIDWGF
jgi:TonB-linked SusC/RagA family outer membrane protein